MQPVQMTISQFRELVITDYSNQRKNDKSSLGYSIGAMKSNTNASIYWDSMTRKELLNDFTAIIQDDKCLSRLLTFTCYRHITITADDVIPENNLPAKGRCIVFTTKPNGSYVTEGVPYYIAQVDTHVSLRNTTTEGGTHEHIALVKQSTWHYVPTPAGW